MKKNVLKQLLKIRNQKKEQGSNKQVSKGNKKTTKKR